MMVNGHLCDIKFLSSSHDLCKHVDDLKKISHSIPSSGRISWNSRFSTLVNSLVLADWPMLNLILCILSYLEKQNFFHDGQMSTAYTRWHNWVKTVRHIGMNVSLQRKLRSFQNGLFRHFCIVVNKNSQKLRQSNRL